LFGIPGTVFTALYAAPAPWQVYKSAGRLDASFFHDPAQGVSYCVGRARGREALDLGYRQRV
jgi:hypothetical protein